MPYKAPSTSLRAVLRTPSLPPQNLVRSTLDSRHDSDGPEHLRLVPIADISTGDDPQASCNSATPRFGSTDHRWTYAYFATTNLRDDCEAHSRRYRISEEPIELTINP